MFCIRPNDKGEGPHKFLNMGPQLYLLRYWLSRFTSGSIPNFDGSWMHGWLKVIVVSLELGPIN